MQLSFYKCYNVINPRLFPVFHWMILFMICYLFYETKWKEKKYFNVHLCIFMFCKCTCFFHSEMSWPDVCQLRVRAHASLSSLVPSLFSFLYFLKHFLCFQFSVSVSTFRAQTETGFRKLNLEWPDLNIRTEIKVFHKVFLHVCSLNMIHYSNGHTLWESLSVTRLYTNSEEWKKWTWDRTFSPLTWIMAACQLS